MDFIIVILSILNLIVTADFAFIKVLRIARILRPLRLIARSQSLKVAIAALFKAIPKIVRLQIIVCFMLFIFSILLTSQLSGKMFRCDLSHTALS